MKYACLKATTFSFLFAGITAWGCGSGKAESTVGETGGDSGSGNAGGSGNSGGDGGSALSGGVGGAGGSIVVDGGNTGGTGADGGVNRDAACVDESIGGEKTIVDLYFMIDSSGSMNCPVPDPAGACEVDPGPPYSAVTRWTEISEALKLFFAAPESAGMGAGLAFFPRNNGGSLACSAADYSTPSVPIAALPGSSAALAAAIDQQRPGGNTPTAPSLQGAIDHARSWMTSNPGHVVAVVYSTDGYPRGCGGSNTIANAAQAAAAAFQGTPSVKTFVLGEGSNLTDLNQIAVSGGTNQAFFVDTGQDITAQLAAALAAIRQSVSLSCTYTIPPPRPGTQIDFDKVNIRYTNGAGEEIEVTRDPSASDCAQGWQYNADRTQIILCGEICETVKTDPDGRIDVLIGCETVIGPPA